MNDIELDYEYNYLIDKYYYSHDYDDCWLNGDYTDQYCEECPYRAECSGNEG